MIDIQGNDTVQDEEIDLQDLKSGAGEQTAETPEGNAGSEAGAGPEEQDSAQMKETPEAGTAQEEEAPQEEQDPQNGEASEAEPEEAGSEENGAEEAGGTGDAQDSAKETGRKGFFRKKDKKDKRDQQIEELTDRVRRQMAEFDNFRKRTEKEKAANFEIGAKSVIEKILPVVDNFERGLAAANHEDPFTDGMQKIYKQLMTTLESIGVTPIEAVGQEFNPDLHNAVMHVDDESVGDNIVVEELQKGYKYHDSVVRYSMVKVAN